MTKLGLSEPILRRIQAILRNHRSVEWAAVFGSRAMGREQPYSDIDLALGGPLGDLEVERIALELDELPVPVRFDLVGVDNLQHGPLREHIERVGAMIYRRDAAAPDDS